MTSSLVLDIVACIGELSSLPVEERVSALNAIRVAMHSVSPFANEPVDCVLWVRSNEVAGNEYNPNTVAPPEMQLLELSITADGYTQPIVTWKPGEMTTSTGYEVVDGFHRNRIGKECPPVRERLHGYLPVVVVNVNRVDKGDRIASTIRHNRARGKHQIDAMSDIVIELKRRNWADERICRELGMDPDEVLRLCQITGLSELFSDQEFSKSWDVEGAIVEDDFQELTDDTDSYIDDVKDIRVVNVEDENRIFHTHDKWECFAAGFYATTKEGMTKDECEAAYRDFLSSPKRFSSALERVVKKWKYSCEHYLTNVAMNRIAWLGQAASCYAMGIPATYRNGFNLLTPVQQEKANKVALKYLNRWLEANGRPKVSMDEAMSYERQSDIY